MNFSDNMHGVPTVYLSDDPSFNVVILSEGSFINKVNFCWEVESRERGSESGLFDQLIYEYYCIKISWQDNMSVTSTFVFTGYPKICVYIKLFAP